MTSLFACAACGEFHSKEAGKSGAAEYTGDPRICAACAEKMVKCECGYFFSAESMTSEGECFPCYIERTGHEGSADIPVGKKPLREIVYH
jgi:hypothetical protein